MKVLIIIVLIADMQMAINPACKDSWDTLQLEILQHLLLKDMPVLPKYAKYLACQADKFRCLSVVAPFMSMTVFPRGAEWLGAGNDPLTAPLLVLMNHQQLIACM